MSCRLKMMTMKMIPCTIEIFWPAKRSHRLLLLWDFSLSNILYCSYHYHPNTQFNQLILGILQSALNRWSRLSYFSTHRNPSEILVLYYNFISEFILYSIIFRQINSKAWDSWSLDLISKITIHSNLHHLLIFSLVHTTKSSVHTVLGAWATAKIHRVTAPHVIYITVAGDKQ